jgi:predicted secreted Zn-dependent protease
MVKHLKLLCPVLFSLLFNPAIASAQSTDTQYTYYLIAGESAASLHFSMLRKGPKVRGGRAYASASMEPEVNIKTRSSGGSCRIENFKVNMTFSIQLPQLKKAISLHPAVRKSFEDFRRFAKRHEETHRSIWLTCARVTEARARKIKARTCSQAESEAFKVFYSAMQRCDARQTAFDASEKRRLQQIPFIKQASERLAD